MAVIASPGQGVDIVDLHIIIRSTWGGNFGTRGVGVDER
jgi:hypothetical protein